MLILVLGCSSKLPHTLVPDYGTRGVRLVAVLPVVNQTANPAAVRILRDRVLEELYFRGYPKIPLDVIDGRLAQGGAAAPRDRAQGQAVGRLLGVDALLWMTLEECSQSTTLIYANTTLAVRFEMQSVKTGETLWQMRHRTVVRDFSYSRGSVELKAVQSFEPAIKELIGKAMTTLPDGPDL